MGHVRGMVDIDGETKPYIVIDLAMRIHAAAGREIFLSDIRHIIYSLRDERRFKIEKVSMDGFQSTDFLQQLTKRRFQVETISVDKNFLPYTDLRDAIYEGRLEFPPYMVEIQRGDITEISEIIVQELSELVDTGPKVDHPEQGSKDVADCLAGVVTSLMGDRRYHRKVRNLNDYREAKAVGQSHPAYLGDPGTRAPIPPAWR